VQPFEDKAAIKHCVRKSLGLHFLFSVCHYDRTVLTGCIPLRSPESRHSLDSLIIIASSLDACSVAPDLQYR
jgi:hypothetical protein